MVPYLLAAAGLFVALLLILWPVQWAGRAMGARRTGLGWCFLALVVATLLQAAGSVVPVAGNLVAFLLGALGFAAMLDTTFIRGVGIAVLHVVFSILIVVVAIGIASLLGFAVALPIGL